MKKLIFILIFFGYSLLVLGNSYAEVFFIANLSVDVDALSKSEVKKIFLGDKKVWDNGNAIILVTMKENDTHNEFLKKYVKRSSMQFKRFWRNKVFLGQGDTPKSFSNEEEMIEYLKQTTGAIGYASRKVDGLKSINNKK